jgi:phage gp29-like protein
MSKSSILGPDGRPYDLDDLFGPPRAGPSLTSVRRPTFASEASGLTPGRLAAILRDIGEGDAEAYLVIAEEMEERDPHYRAVIGTRKRAVAQLPVRVEAASDDEIDVAAADLVRDWLGTKVFARLRMDLLDAIAKGYSVVEWTWGVDPRSGRQWPVAGHARPQRWFEIDREDGRTLLLRRDDGGREPLVPHKFLVHVSAGKSGLPIRAGLARVAAWSWMLKTFGVEDWGAFVRNHGAPIRLGRYDASTSAEDREVLWRAVANIAGDCAAIIPKGMEIEFVEVKSVDKGGELYEKRADWLDRQISKLVLGQTTTTDAVSGGHAVSKEHRLVQEDIERSDAEELATTLNMQLVPFLVALALGPAARPPEVVIGRLDEVPLPEVVNALDKLVPLGLRVEASEVRDRLGFAEPAPDAEVLAASNLAKAPGTTGSDRQETAPPILNFQAARRAVDAHAVQPEPRMVARLADRAASDAAGALAGMTDAVRAAIEDAGTYEEASAALAALNLDTDDFARALAGVMALAHLAGRASVIDELDAPGDAGDDA